MKPFKNIGFFGGDFFFLKKVNSTSSFVKEQIKNLKNGDTVWAWQQTKGYGRYSRKWQSQNGKTLTFSFVLQSDFLKQKQINNFIFSCQLNQIISLTIVLFLQRQYNIEAKIKFPNDIYVGNKKICGILIENISDSDKDYCIVGIGLNVFSVGNDNFSCIAEQRSNKENNSKNNKKNRENINSSNSVNLSLAFIVKQLLNDLQDSLFYYLQNGYSSFKEKINHYQMVLGKKITFYQQEEELENQQKKIHGKIIAINDDFTLLVETVRQKVNVFYDDHCQIDF